MVFFNKKAVSDILSFVLLLFIILIVSISAYTFSKSQLNSDLTQIDVNNMNNFLFYFSNSFSSLFGFDNSQISKSISFNSGSLVFENNYIYYQSLIKMDSNLDFCKGLICYNNVGGFQRIYYNLSNNYYFKNNLSLTPGSYTLSFKNIKNESKIEVLFIE